MRDPKRERERWATEKVKEKEEILTNNGTSVANEIRNREYGLDTLFVVLLHLEGVVVGYFEVEDGVIAGLHLNLVGDKVRAEHQNQRSQGVGPLRLTS